MIYYKVGGENLKRKIIAIGAIGALVALLMIAGPAAAHPAQNGFDESPVYENDYGDHYAHESGSPRFNFDDGNAPKGIAVSDADADPAKQAVVQPHGGGILINPAE